MIQAVLMSINPEHCVNIALGKKTLEIRKKKPDFHDIFRVYIYCTSLKPVPISKYAAMHAATGGRIDEWAGKVFAAFDCDYIVTDARGEYADELCKFGMITMEQLVSYAPRGTVYGLHISDLEIFNEPLSLDKFRCKGRRMQHPPQGWCYVADPFSDLARAFIGGAVNA